MELQEHAMRRGLAEADIIITTGGTSMGEADLLKVCPRLISNNSMLIVSLVASDRAPSGRHYPLWEGSNEAWETWAFLSLMGNASANGTAISNNLRHHSGD